MDESPNMCNYPSASVATNKMPALCLQSAFQHSYNAWKHSWITFLKMIIKWGRGSIGFHQILQTYESYNRKHEKSQFSCQIKCFSSTSVFHF
jgi:hypothetical protein